MRKISILSLCIIFLLFSSISTFAASKPAKVKLNEATVSKNSVTLKWNKTKNAKGYQIYRNNIKIKTVSSKVISYKNINLKENTKYTYKVRAYTTYKQWQWFNKKTKKWQTKKPSKKYRGKSKIVTKYLYGAFSNSKTIKIAHRHSFGQWNTSVKPSCDKTGISIRKCICGISERKVIPKINHKWSNEKVVLSDSTCLKEGEKGYVCTICRAIKDRENIPKKEHVIECIKKEPTCTNSGNERHICAICNTVLEDKTISAIGHSWSEPVETPATCTEDGKIVSFCKNCGEEKHINNIPSHGHSFSSWNTIQNPTCNDTGLKQRVCTKCSYTETTNIDKSEHDWEDTFIVDKMPSCISEGSQSIHCKNCSATKDPEVIPVIEHDYDKTVLVEASCTTQETCEFKCKICDHTIIDHTKDKLGHDYSIEKIITEPTCFSRGLKKIYCSRCNSTKSEGLNIVNHSPEDWVILKEATQLNTGKREKYCKYCYGTMKTETIPKIVTEEELSCANNLDGKEFTLYYTRKWDSTYTGKEVNCELPENAQTRIDNIYLPGWEIKQNKTVEYESTFMLQNGNENTLRRFSAIDNLKATVNGEDCCIYNDPNYAGDITYGKPGLTYTYTATKNNMSISFSVTSIDYSWVIVEDIIDNYIADNITEDMTELEKVKTVAKFVGSRKYSISDDEETFNYTAQLFVLGGYGVCTASARTFKIFLDKLGIESEYNYPTEDHINNKVFLQNGDIYIVDVTCGDSPHSGFFTKVN